MVEDKQVDFEKVEKSIEYPNELFRLSKIYEGIGLEVQDTPVENDKIPEPFEYTKTTNFGTTQFRCDLDEAPDEWFEPPYPFRVEVTDVVNNPEDDVEGRDEVMEVIDNYGEFTEPYVFSSGSIAFNVEEESCDIVRPLGKRIVEQTGRVITGIRVRNGRLQIWTDPLQTPAELEDED